MDPTVLASNSAYNTPYANATFLPMLLLSLASQPNAPKNTDKEFKTKYDYIIVGAGAAGSVLARRLSEVPCASILVLEAGGAPPLLADLPLLSRNFWFSDLDWQYRTVPLKNTARGLKDNRAIWPSGKGLGGSTIFSAGVYSRANKADFDGWARQGCVGWSASDVYPYYLKMEDNRDPEYLTDGYHVVGGPQTVERPKYKSEIKEPILEAAKQLGDQVLDPNAFIQTGFSDPQEFLRNGQRCASAKSYLVPAENRTNLNILTNAFVTKVRFQRRRATGVEFEYKGQSHVVKARREVILSAGTVNTPQILMLSGVGPKKELHKFKIPLMADLPVGDNFQDQIGSLLSFTLNSSIPSVPQKITDDANIQEYIQNKTGPLSETEGITAIAFGNGNPESEGDLPNYLLYFAELPKEVIRDTIGLKPQVFDAVFAPYGDTPIYICLAQNLQVRSRGTIRLNSTDPRDPPLIDPNYLGDPRDIEAIVQGLKKCKEIGTSDVMKSSVGSELFTTVYPGCEGDEGDDEAYFDCVTRTVMMAMTHQVGTAKMGDPKDPTTVVDPTLRVKGLKGLRVVDASIMPIILTGNTIAPTIMVAEKAADMIKGTITCDTQIPGGPF